MPFELHHHATMLSDRLRLSTYRYAIEATVRPTDCVVDVGTGTGILASFAAPLTQNQVYGIEYFSEAAHLAQRLMQQAAYENVSILNTSSYACQLDTPPDVLITETIGPIGTEENIVELTHLFCRQFPSVRQVIPARLRLLAVPVYAESVEQRYAQLLNAYRESSHGSFDYQAVFDLLNDYAGTYYFQGELKDCVILGEPTVLIEYDLGKSQRSDFSAIVSACKQANAIHLFFQADLTSDCQLSSFAKSPMTHWRHSFVRVPQQRNQLEVSYSSTTRQFTFTWGTV